MLKPKLRLLTPIAIVLGTLGIGSWGIASLKTDHEPNSTLAQSSDGMNHDGMNHDQMNHKTSCESISPIL